MPQRRISKQKSFLFFGDIFIILLALFITFVIRFGALFFKFLKLEWDTILILLFLYPLGFFVFDLYDSKLEFKNTRFIGQILGAIFFVAAIMLLVFYFFPYLVGRGVFFINLVLVGFFAAYWRIIFVHVFKVTIRQRRLLVVGDAEHFEVVKSIIKENPEYKLCGYMDGKMEPTQNGISDRLGNFSNLKDVVRDHTIDDIIIGIELSDDPQISSVMLNCRLEGVSISDLPTFYENMVGKLPIQFIKEKWLLYSYGFSRIGNKVTMRIKRITDIIISSLLLILLSPFGLLISLFIKLDSKGRVFFLQERIGENSQPFKLIKFRTMITGAEKQGPQWASENDSRITRMGKVLRKTRIDEAPQLINILKGEMSLIGPRPERKFFIDQLGKEIPYYSLRFSIKPGLTGWAQVNYQYGASIEDSMEKLQYDLFYIKNMSLLLDLNILLKTIRTVLFGQGR